MISMKRRKYLIKKSFQLKYTVIILMVIFLTSLISCVAIYMALFPYLSEKLANVYPQGRLVVVLKNAQFNALVSTAVLFPVALWFGVILSHRIAGPWYRLENILRDIAEGKITSEVKLRKGDELQSLADAINGTIRNLRSTGEQNIGYLQALNDTLRLLEQEMGREQIDLMKVKLLVSKLHDLSGDLRTLANRQSPDTTA